MKRLVLSLIFVFLAPNIAFAQWFYDKNESSFGDSDLHMIFSGSGEYGIAFRCSKDQLELVYVTSEQVTDVTNINSLDPEVMIRVDKNDILKYPAKALSLDGKLAFLADIPAALIREVEAAKRGVAVVVEVFSDNYHEMKFGVRGSTRAAGKLLKSCENPAISSGDQ